ncbi:MAG: deoxyribose-phosphate aldolase [Bdellovibrionales bacterium]|nr:deoxyribose-phosphate aldolase [Bdellovibrionales bacterium]
MKTIAHLFDHTVLKQDATSDDVKNLCREAREHNFFSVCVNPCWIRLTQKELAGSAVKVCTVIGFPLGANTTEAKLSEAQDAISLGADELDFVMNVGALKSGDFNLVKNELKTLIQAVDKKALSKIIVESGALTREELSQAIQAVNESGAEFIKTSTGFFGTGATVEAIKLMRELGRPGLKIKASGGIRSYDDFQKFYALNVERVGASKSVEILKDWMARS